MTISHYFYMGPRSLNSRKLSILTHPLPSLSTRLDLLLLGSLVSSSGKHIQLDVSRICIHVHKYRSSCVYVKGILSN